MINCSELIFPFSDINSVAHMVETLRSRIDLSVILDLNAYTTRYVYVHVHVHLHLHDVHVHGRYNIVHV